MNTRQFIKCFTIGILSLTATRVHAQNAIPWSPAVKLSWDDFRSAPDPALPFTAYTHTTTKWHFHWDRNGRLSTTVDCYFLEDESWKRPERNLTPYLLQHETGHFNISEVFARKLQEAFDNYTLTHRHSENTQSDLDMIYKSVMEQKKAVQAQYDEQTNHAKNKEAQEAWDAKIAGWLYASKGFSK